MVSKLPEDPRIRLAAERTLLAWIRTGLALMGFGFVVARFGLFLKELSALGRLPLSRSLGVSLWIGIVLVGMGMIVNAFAAREQLLLLNALAIHPKKMSHYFGGAIAIVLSALGGVIIAYLFLLRSQ